MMRRRLPGVAAALVGLLIYCAGVIPCLAQDAAQEEAEYLVIDDFEDNVGARWGGDIAAEKVLVKEGDQAGRWITAGVAREINCYEVPHNWTGYTNVELWVYSGKANDSEFVLNAYTDNDLTEGIDYIQRRFRVDWEGWKRFSLPLDSFKIGRQPTLERIERVTFSNHGWEMTPAGDTELVFDDLVLTRGEKRALPPGVIEDFEGDVSAISGMEIAQMDGRSCGRWHDMPRMTSVGTRPVSDWTPYGFLEMDIYSKVANDDQFLLMVESDDPQTDGPDYWDHWFYVDWEGWRHFKIPLRRMHQMRSPLGLDMVTGLSMFADGWGMPVLPDTDLYFDDIKLTEGDDLLPPEVIDNFEMGVGAWWGDKRLDTEHVHGGTQAMRITVTDRYGEVLADENGSPVTAAPDPGVRQGPDGTALMERIGPDGQARTTKLKTVPSRVGQVYTNAIPVRDWDGKAISLWVHVSQSRAQPVLVRVDATGLRGMDGDGTWSGLLAGQVIAGDGEHVLKVPVSRDEGPQAQRGQAEPSSLLLGVYALGAEAEPGPVVCVDDIEVVEAPAEPDRVEN